MQGYKFFLKMIAKYTSIIDNQYMAQRNTYTEEHELAKALEEYNKAVAAYLKQVDIQRVRYSIKQTLSKPQ
jgi:hypothetical protein